MATARSTTRKDVLRNGSRCRGCRRRDKRIAALERENANLKRANARLKADLAKCRERAKRNSTNSSQAPSQDPPDAPKRQRKKPTGRKKGGQPGHPHHPRPPLTPDEVIPLVPSDCEHCRAKLPRKPGPNDPEPHRHQIVETPIKLIHVTEYRGAARTCKHCGQATWATIPADVRAHGVGPRLTAIVSYLSGCHHVSKRGIEEVVETIFGAPMALGTVSNLEQEMRQALDPAYAEVEKAVHEADVKNVDETGWKQAGKKCWLWTAVTTTFAFFVIHTNRNYKALTTLLGEAIFGTITSDRWSAYSSLPPGLRQLCWAHLKRDFQKCVDRGGPAAAIGNAGLAIVARLFDAWKRFRGGGTRGRLIKEMQPVIRDCRKLLEQGACCADDSTATFCKNLLKLELALWNFVCIPRVEPTNNLAERVLRRGVLWRKNSFGCDSPNGCRFVERILTVVQTLRLRQQKVIDYLHQAILAHRAGQPAPKLLKNR